jgi:hypothetical protein
MAWARGWAPGDGHSFGSGTSGLLSSRQIGLNVPEGPAPGNGRLLAKLVSRHQLTE